MAISQATAIGRIRDLLDEISALERVFAPSENEADKLPDVLNEFPCVVVLQGTTLDYILTTGGHRHTYEVRLVYYLRQGSDTGESAYQGVTIPDAIIEKFVGNVTLGGRVNSCVVARQSGTSNLEYNEIDYIGGEIALRLSEQASATPAIGS